jgi:hypothetical protein
MTRAGPSERKESLAKLTNKSHHASEKWQRAFVFNGDGNKPYHKNIVSALHIR